MNILDRYLSVNYLKVFLSVALASMSLILLYSLTDFLFGFKEKSLEVVVKYVAYLIPVGFYVLSSIVVNISLLILFRRLLSKKIDLTVQSFGISPLRFLAVLITGILSLSFLFLLLNESFLPSMFKKLWYVEKTFKKKQEIGRLVERFWFVKETSRGKYFVYIGSLDVSKGRFADLFMLKTSSEGKVLEVVEGRSGSWKGNVIKVDKGSAYNFKEGYFVRELSNFSLGVEIGVDEIGLFAEKIEHVKASSLLNLYLKGTKLGLDTDRYLSEILYRGGMSMLPFLVALPLMRQLMKYRSMRVGSVSFVVYLLIGWLLVISPKLLAEKANLTPTYSLLAYGVYLLYLLKGVHDLRKGFRV